MVTTYLDFEKPIAELEGKIRELSHLSDAGELNIAKEVTRLQTKVQRLLQVVEMPRQYSLGIGLKILMQNRHGIIS